MATLYKKKDKDLIPLAKGYNLDKLTDDVIVMEKFDGVPLWFTKDIGGNIIGQTRKGKLVTSSVDHIVEELKNFLYEGQTVVMEVFVKGQPLKISSGHVRRDKPCPELQGVIWDMWDDNPHDVENHRGSDFFLRIDNIDCQFTYEVLTRIKSFDVVNYKITNKTNIESAFTKVQLASATNPTLFEGFIVRDKTSKSLAGTRHWDYQKVVFEPTMDLFVVGFEEAIDKHNKPTGRTGALLVVWGQDGSTCGVGSGKLTFPEREELFNVPKTKHVGLPKRPNAVWYRIEPDHLRIAQIKYKKDPHYDGIRQGTFQCWRDDKTEENIDD
jgi:ATP-dependent DNA ligase